MIRELKLYTPHSKQLEFHNSKKRYRVAALGRQAGKSSMCLNELARHAWENKNHTYWFVSPTFEQAKIQYRKLVSMLWDCSEVMTKKNQTELRIKLVTQSEILFKSGEVMENLRGSTLHGAVLDEVRDLPMDLWQMVIRPMLATTKGWASFVSTPNGFDQFYELAQNAQKFPDQWDFLTAPSTCNPLWTNEEYEAARASMTEPQFAQEIKAEFRDITAGKAYLCHGEHNHLFTTFWPTSDPDRQVSDKHPVYVLCDFNLTPMSWSIAQCDGFKWYIFDEISLNESHTQEAAALLVTKLNELRSKNLLRYAPQVIVVGDATGKAGQRAAAGKSDYDILFAELKTAGFNFRDETPDSNPMVVDRVNTVNSFLKSASGQVRLFYNPVKCPKLKADFEKVVWKTQGVLSSGKDKMLTHMSDNVGYGICKITPLVKEFEVGTPRVLIR